MTPGKIVEEVNQLCTPVKIYDGSNVNANKIKSPSDTTIYIPGLNKVQRNDNMIDKISNFVETV